jgi:hypothetical protein
MIITYNDLVLHAERSERSLGMTTVTFPGSLVSDYVLHTHRTATQRKGRERRIEMSART